MIPLINAMAQAGWRRGDPFAVGSAVLGACLGGNGTLIGSSADLTVAGIAQREGLCSASANIRRYALPLTAIGIILCQSYLALRYF